MDLKFETKSIKSKTDRHEHYSYLDHSNHEENNYFYQEKLENLLYKLNKLQVENDDLKKQNKTLTNKVDFLLNNNTIVKNVKNEMNDCSQISHYHSVDSLKEFFFLLVICEKMNYLDQDKMWTVDSNYLYKLALKNDLNFYEWPKFIKDKLIEEYQNNYNKIEIRKKEVFSCYSKLKNIWYESSFAFFDKIKDLKYNNKKGTEEKIKGKLNKIQLYSTNMANNKTSNTTNFPGNIKGCYMREEKINVVVEENINLRNKTNNYSDYNKSNLKNTKTNINFLNNSMQLDKINTSKTNNIYNNFVGSSGNKDKNNISTNDDLENLLQFENDCSFNISEMETI